MEIYNGIFTLNGYDVNNYLLTISGRLWTNYNILGNSINLNNNTLNYLQNYSVSIPSSILSSTNNLQNQLNSSFNCATYEYTMITSLSRIVYYNSSINKFNTINLYSGLSSLSGVLWSDCNILANSININNNTLNYHQNYIISLSSIVYGSIYQPLQNQINIINSSTSDSYLYNYVISLSRFLLCVRVKSGLLILCLAFNPSLCSTLRAVLALI
jgi:hypothetical protein